MPWQNEIRLADARLITGAPYAFSALARSRTEKANSSSMALTLGLSLHQVTSSMADRADG
jgi:hypothetical protein